MLLKPVITYLSNSLNTFSVYLWVFSVLVSNADCILLYIDVTHNESI